jgi:hypothetical protein
MVASHADGGGAHLVWLHDHAAVVGDHLGSHRDVHGPDAGVQATHLLLPARRKEARRGCLDLGTL